MTPGDAAAAVETRLRHLRLIWEDAASKYFDPEPFTIALQSCVTTARAVTFILQSHKASFPDFETWYAAYQEKWRADPVMRWVVDARNTVEKRGDLEKLSQVRGSIVASYLGAAVSDWVAAPGYVSSHQMLRSIPSSLLDKQVVEHGTLVIERRWIDANLPDREVLDALAHVYGELASLVGDLLGRVGEAARSAKVEQRPRSMQPLLMDRAVYVSIRTGQTFGHRLFARESSADEIQEARSRYKKFMDWSDLTTASSFKDQCDVVFRHARGVMQRDHYHRSIALLFKGGMLLRVVSMDFPDRAAKYVMIRDLAAVAKIIGCDGVMLIGEAWSAPTTDAPPSGYASEAQNPEEHLSMTATDNAGACHDYTARIVRKRFKRHRVKSLGSTRYHDGLVMMLTPFHHEWGCLDMEAVEENERLMRSALAKSAAGSSTAQ